MADLPDTFSDEARSPAARELTIEYGDDAADGGQALEAAE